MKKSFLIVIICLLSIASFAQDAKEEFIYKDPSGKVLTEAQVDKIAKGGMSMKKGEMENGKRVMIIIPITKEEIKRQEIEREEKLMALLNQPLPDFSFTDLKGNIISNADLKGKVVVLNFWFVECSPCIREMPELNALVEKFRDSKDIIFIAPTFSDKAKVDTFLTKRAFAYTIVPDVKEYMKKLQISSFPTNLIIGKDGIVRYASSGFEEGIGKKLIANITPLLTK